MQKTFLLCWAIISGLNVLVADGPWRDCTENSKVFRVESDSMRPSASRGDTRRLVCFKHAMAGSTMNADEITLETIHPEIKRGSLVAFRHPTYQDETWFKRVIGLPGDKIELDQQTIIVNGVRSTLDAANGRYGGASSQQTQIYWETLPGGTPHLVYDEKYSQHSYEQGRKFWVVPKNALFVLGDNRNQSIDSRLSTFGFVPLENTIGIVEDASS